MTLSHKLHSNKKLHKYGGLANKIICIFFWIQIRSFVSCLVKLSRQMCRGLLIHLTLFTEDANSVQLSVVVDAHANIDVDFDVHDYFDVDNYILKLDMLAAFV